jgi:hypothetical protein
MCKTSIFVDIAGYLPTIVYHIWLGFALFCDLRQAIARKFDRKYDRALFRKEGAAQL